MVVTGCFWGVGGAYSGGGGVVGRGIQVGVFVGDLEGFCGVCGVWWLGLWCIIRYGLLGVGVWIWRIVWCFFVEY